MRNTCDRVARITRELRALSTHLRWHAFQNSSPSDQTQILNELLNSDLVEDLRTTVDYLSQFLWRYIESAVANSGQEANYELQNERLTRITEMLRLLHRSSCPSQDPLAFVDRVTKSVDRCLETASQDDMLSESRADDARTCPPGEAPRVGREGTATRGLSERQFLDSWR
jgi:hypothetical protein